MSTANINVYGNPADYINVARLLYRDSATWIGRTDALMFPVEPYFGGTQGNTTQGRLSTGISNNKVSTADNIDLSIAMVGQDKEASGLSSIEVWKVIRDSSDHPKPVRDKIVNFDNNINTFFYTYWGNDYTNPNICSGYLPTNNSYTYWCPNGVMVGSDNYYRNPHSFVYPIVDYGAKAILLCIYVGVRISSDISTGLTWVALNQWRDSYSQYSVAGIRCVICTPYQIFNNRIDYTTLSDAAYSYGSYERVSMGMLHNIDGYSNYFNFTNSEDKSSFVLLNYYSFNDSTEKVGSDIRAYLPMYGMFENEETWYSWQVNTWGGDRVYIWKQFPYSEANYNKILSIVACFGVPFTPVNKTSFDMTWNNNDLYFPIIDRNGITHGEYTHGAANLTNPFNNVNSVREFNYNPYGNTFNIYLGDLQIDKIYLGDREIDKVYLGDIAL